MMDFDRVRETLGKAADKIAGHRDEQSVAKLLRERSRRMAGRTGEQEERELFAHVVVVRRGEARIGVPIQSVDEVRSVEIAALPRATEVVQGLFQVRGQVYTVIDIGPFFGESSPVEHGVRVLVMLVKGRPGTVGLRVDEVLGPREIAVDELEDGIHGGRIDFVSHVTGDLLEIVDVDAMLSMPALRAGRS